MSIESSMWMPLFVALSEHMPKEGCQIDLTIAQSSWSCVGAEKGLAGEPLLRHRFGFGASAQ